MKRLSPSPVSAPVIAFLKTRSYPFGRCFRTLWLQNLGRILCLAFFLSAVALPLAAQNSTPTTTTAPTALPAPTFTSTNSLPLEANDSADPHVHTALDTIFAQMTVADKVGQLFVITFYGNEVSATSDIVELIHQYRVGGVVLTPEQRNFSNEKGVDTPRQVATLINQLQAVAYGFLLPPDQALTPLSDAPWPPPHLGALVTDPEHPPLNLPLLIGVKQLGGGLANTALRGNFTPLPTQMALGATWDPTIVRAVGRIVGSELRAVGINLLLGPNLDVITQPRTDAIGRLGVHTFGGNPEWVSLMARQYIAGVHSGGNNRIATFASHFPGQGDVDRLPDEEVATVTKSLDELRKVALLPFLNVTKAPSTIQTIAGDASSTDGLLTSHMRFSALQRANSSRETPISLTPNFDIVLQQEGLENWHRAGGLLMSNELGSRAIRRFYDTSLQDFPYKQAALAAFVAGHDLIYLSHLSADNSWPSEKKSIEDTIVLFQERYRTDQIFARQVDNAVRRILHLKLRLYADLFTATDEKKADASGPSIPLKNVLVQQSDLNIFATGNQHRLDSELLMTEVARKSITILHPDAANLVDVLPDPPQITDHLLIFTDSRLFRECSDCASDTTLGPDEVKEIIIALFGSKAGATGQILDQNVIAKQFSELDTLLSAELTATQNPPTTTIAITDSGGLSVTLGTITEDTSNVSQTNANPSSETKLKRYIEQATWLIFVMFHVDPITTPNSDVVKRFLDQYSEQITNKKVVVLALNAPYFLESTDINKLSVYLGVYNKTEPFLKSAVHAIFRTYIPTGAPPVSVPGTGRYENLAERLQPDPAIPLQLRAFHGNQELTLSLQPGSPDTAVLQAGNLLTVRIEGILDRNGHIVPNRTPVHLNLIYEGEMALPVEPALTNDGAASWEIPLTRSGRLSISATALDAKSGDQPFLLNILESDTSLQTPPVTLVGTKPTVGVATGQAALTATQNPTGHQTITQTQIISPSVTPPVAQGGELNEPLPIPIPLMTLAVALLTIGVTLSLLLILQIHILPLGTLIHNMLWATIFGLSAYILYGLGLIPGIGFIRSSLRIWGAAPIVFIAMLLPLLWLQLRAELMNDENQTKSISL